MKGRLGYIIGLLALLVVLVFAESVVPKEADWRATYAKRDKIPFGTFVLRQSLTDLFPDYEVNDIDRSFFQEWLDESFEDGSLLVITQNFYPDSLDLSLLFDRVARGNTALIAAENFSQSLVDSLDIHFAYNFTLKDTVSNLQCLGKNNWGPSFRFDKMSTNQWFEIDSVSNAEAIGKSNQKINFIRVPYGDGFFLLHSQPKVFTNFHVLYNDHQYQERVLSWLDSDLKKLDWDEYYKPFRLEANTPLKVILSIPALRAAYWTLLIGLFLYIISNMRRRQRAIPVVPPKMNLSLDFVQTIGLLYFDTKDHKNLATKMFAVFTEHIHSQYLLRIEQSDAFYKQLAAKSGTPEKLIRSIFDRHRLIQAKMQITEADLMTFNKEIEQFYQLSSQGITKTKLENSIPR